LASTSAFSFSFVTIVFLAVTSTAIISASAFFLSTSTYLTTSVSFNPSTYSSVFSNLARPFSNFSFLTKIAVFFLPSIPVNNLINSKKDFGVM
jgi:hypothetical protein